MDNEFSQASIEVPVVPANFEATTGNSKRSFAAAILALLRGASIRGINVEQPQNFDLAELQNRITKLESDAAANTLRQRTIPFTGIVSGTVTTVPFEDIGTLGYWVDVCFTTANAALGSATWSLIEGSKQTAQCQVRVDGTAGPYKFEVHVITNNQ